MSVDSLQLRAPVDSEKNTPLHIAAKRGHLETIKLLTEMINDDAIRARNNQGKTPIHLAIEFGHVRWDNNL